MISIEGLKMDKERIGLNMLMVGGGSVAIAIAIYLLGFGAMLGERPSIAMLIGGFAVVIGGGYLLLDAWADQLARDAKSEIYGSRTTNQTASYTSPTEQRYRDSGEHEAAIAKNRRQSIESWMSDRSPNIRRAG